jgi:hypothetical protein
VKVQVEVIVPPTGTVTGDGLQTAVRPVIGLTVVDRATAPAKPFVAGGLPKLRRVTISVADPVVVVNDTVGVAAVTLKPLTLIVWVPETLFASGAETRFTL